MKYFHFLILALLAGSCLPRSKDSQNTISGRKNESSLPAFENKEEIHNFGKLVAGEMAVYTFSFRNAGAGNLDIVKTETGCSCLTVEPGEKLIKPGETGTIKVIFNTSGLYGRQFQTCRIFSSCEGITMDIGVTADVVNDEIELKQL
jgi:hypothetical protein